MVFKIYIANVNSIYFIRIGINTVNSHLKIQCVAKKRTPFVLASYRPCKNEKTLSYLTVPLNVNVNGNRFYCG